MTKQLTGRHVLMIFCGAFGIIIGVNLLLAWSAVSTFPGLEVKNSYVASQQFDDRKAAQEALGWTVRADAAEGEVILRFTDAQGLPVRVGALDAVVGRATHVADDIRPEFIFDGVAYVAPVHLADGNWNIRLTALAENGTQFSQRVILHVKR
ncbi:MAG: FixH family protein [Paracoccaceae bacterium]